MGDKKKKKKRERRVSLTGFSRGADNGESANCASDCEVGSRFFFPFLRYFVFLFTAITWISSIVRRGFARELTAGGAEGGGGGGGGGEGEG